MHAQRQPHWQRCASLDIFPLSLATRFAPRVAMVVQMTTRDPAAATCRRNL
jgi:hypothetical protein